MASPVLFETPENVQIAYRTAGLGTRFCAWVLDSFFVALIAILLFIVVPILAAAMGIALDEVGRKLGARRPISQDEVRFYFFSVVMLALQLGSLIYFTSSELLVRGQTVGKRACGLRVVKADGFALDAGSVLVRNAFRLIDQIPVLWIVPLLSSRSQRFGDMVAGTLVVAETQDRIGELRAKLMQRDSQESRFRFDAAMLNRTKPTDVEALERILERWPFLTERQRNILLDRIVEPLAKRLAAPSPDPADRQEFLVELLSAIYRRESRRLG
ncbi:MAG TPA: RDD family protein [Planctomycetaceae bacterium]|nr:RDD family protein [Planctomycetaceae bacterium]